MKPVLQEMLEEAVDALEAHDEATNRTLRDAPDQTADFWKTNERAREILAHTVVSRARLLRETWRLQDDREAKP